MKFQKKHILFIGLSLGLTTILLAFGKYNTKPTIQQNSDTNFVKVETKAFLDEIISKKNTFQRIKK